MIDGLTGDQRFFLAYAQAWRTKTARPRCASRSSATATRRASSARTTVRNLDPWYDAFDVLSSQKLYLSPEARVKVW